MAHNVGQVVIVGAGTMGTTLAKLVSSKQWPVRVIDTNQAVLERCRTQLTAALSPQVIADHHVDFQSQWVADESVTIVIESVTENLEIKQLVLAQAEAHCGKDTLIVTNTSGLSIDEIGQKMQYPERLAGAHFFNPADLIPTVEVVSGTATLESTVERTCQFLTQLGKRPAVIHKAVPGFVANRIQHAIMRECLSLLEKGVVNIEALDDIVQFSIGVRLALNGPLLQRDLNGLDTHLNIARYLYSDLEDTHSPSALLESYVEKGWLGAKAGKGFYAWSDEKVAQRSANEGKRLSQIIDIALDNDKEADE